MTGIPFPVDYDALRRALVQAVVVGCGLDQNHVIMSEPEQPGAPRPRLPYMTLKVITANIRYGYDQADVGAPDAAGNTATTYCGPRAAVVSFQAFGRSHEEALGLLGLWGAALATEAVREIVGSAGAACGIIGDVTDVSQLLSTGYEGRAAMDVRFNLASNLTVTETTVAEATAAGSVSAGTNQAAAITATSKGS